MSERARILVVEDEKDVRDLILLHLKREGHDATAVEEGEKALELLHSNSYELVVLDWMLPGLSGLEISKKLNHRIPVLMVTARADTSDIVLGLEMGADDYVCKPFEIPILVARVRALLRRSSLAKHTESDETLRIGDLSLDLEGHRTFRGSEEIFLTPSEFKLLHALMKNRGRVLSREKLIELVQGEGVAVVDRAIDTHVFGLRKKLGSCAEFIETIRGVGYRVAAV